MKNEIYKSYIISIIIFSSFIIFGFIVDTPSNIFHGILTIVMNSDILITDYLALGGVGASFVNAGLLTLMCIFILIKTGIKPNGSTIMAIWLMAGFGFFGKNIANIWPIIFGVWLYSKYQKEPFLNYTLIALLGTTLAPTVGQLTFSGYLPPALGIIVGIIITTFIGFILPPLASHCIKVHQGYNLYNVGFAAGILATILMSIFRAFGINFESRFIWYEGINPYILTFLIIIFSFMIIIGFILNGKSFKNVLEITKFPGRLVTDFYLLFEYAAFINMGILGLIFTLYVVIIGGDLNGPVIAGIFTISGFGAFGKHIKNTAPVVLGAILASLLNIWDLNSPQMILSTLFSTTLAPIAGQFGILYGMLAGFLHVCTVMNTGYLHGGLNLYNNGLAGGIVALVLVPIINAFRKEPTK
ncbi:DUF1576 domain-containing protein [Clostridium algidicarnis]|uniref:Uncharacterized protein DUF1576 n=1 Tax=Clostridium algidicarnis DSM 15099 TaxID=1121295 RepID=A0A2S6FUU9_9CLOT|nr:DUF1576 domain-containing protein [Clostridium algidicarnis]MBB6632343.1 DUF1576 domain-containing protein [Clostridium algidicarnis]MBU3205275.1 DUF1576 domain-containing protein [Clostridium algidicarnis]MBU3213428.1 DUF1576 domain-containing protein [Clostridium algidicarnis]MBU3223923.1 DUF1576 domain-containing protein [Clostridium algidicarnis]PPK43907.1 uncharacterized protein DUF1576 [Clostridium algidicarnis DSM 15099]